jgi:hypothetical protein
MVCGGQTHYRRNSLDLSVFLPLSKGPIGVRLFPQANGKNPDSRWQIGPYVVHIGVNTPMCTLIGVMTRADRGPHPYLLSRENLVDQGYPYLHRAHRGICPLLQDGHPYWCFHTSICAKSL